MRKMRKFTNKQIDLMENCWIGTDIFQQPCYEFDKSQLDLVARLNQYALRYLYVRVIEQGYDFWRVTATIPKENLLSSGENYKTFAGSNLKGN